VGFLDRLSVAVGIGVAELTVVLDTPGIAVTPEDVVRGIVHTRGGKIDQTGTLSVCIYEHWTTTTYNAATKTTQVVPHYRGYGETLIAEGLTLKANEPGESFRFALTMPYEGTITREWGVKAFFDVPGSGDARAEITFSTQAPAPIRGLMNVVLAAAPFTLKELSNDGFAYGADFQPNETLKKDFDSVRLLVTLDRNSALVRGELHINPQEHTLQDYLQAFFRTNNRSESFTFAVPEVSGYAETPPGSDTEIVTTLRRLLYPDRANKG
jgi:hypothetical protein